RLRVRTLRPPTARVHRPPSAGHGSKRSGVARASRAPRARARSASRGPMPSASLRGVTPLQELLRAVREACSAATWSRGVELARSKAVIGESDVGDELTFRDSTRGGLVSPQVVLFPEDQDWTCECNSREDACAHVAAAVIALKQARDEGRDLPTAGGDEAPGHIAYRLDGRSGKLQLHRVIVQGRSETALEGSLAAIALRKVEGPKLVATEADLQFEKKLGTFGGGVIPRQLMRKVLEALRDVARLTVDGEPGSVGPPTSGLAARVTETGEGFLVRLEQDREIDEVYENGAVRKKTTVMPVGEHGLSEGEFAALRK